MERKQLFDGTEAFQPYVEADAIPCGVVIDNNSVKKDIENLHGFIQKLLNTVSGGDQVKGSLGVEISYANLATSNILDAEGNETWASTMNPPNTSNPYTWKKTEYTWNVQGSQPTSIRTTYEITATALFPETQIMYAALPAVITNTVKGPGSYGETVVDQSNSSTTWHNYFPGISIDTPFGYMAVRHREAGQEFPKEEGTGGNQDYIWHIALFAMYPMT